jgi:WD40 repeat protein
LIDLDSPDKGEQKLFLPLKRVKMAPDIVVSLAFSPDGRCLVAGMRSGMLYRWELSARTAKLLPRQAHPGAIEHVLFSKDGKTIYSASSNLVKRWDGPSLEEKASWKGDMLFPCLAQHAVDGWISVSDDGKTQRLHPETLRPIGSPLDTHGRHFVLAPDGRTVILGHRRSLWVWDVEGNRLLYTLRLFEEDYAHEQSISDLALSPDGTLLLSASDDTGHVRLWDLISGQLVANLPHGAGHVKLAFSPDGRSFAVTGDQRTLIYELAGLKEQTVIARRPGVVQSFAMVKGGTIACVAEGAQSEQGEIALWPKMLGPEARPNTRVAFAPLSMTVAPPLALPENGRWLAGLNTGTADLRLWDTNGSLRASLPGELPGRSLAVAPDGRLWGAVGDELRAWELPSGNLSASWKNNYGILFRGASALRAVSAGRRWVVATGQDGDVRVFPAGKGPLKVVAARNVTRVPVRSVALSPDERWAVVGSDTGNIWLLSLPDAEVVAELPPRPDRIVALAWAANGLVVSGCYDGTVSVFHHEHERLTELFQLRHRRVLRDVRFCPESVGVAILLSGERGVRLWHLDLVRKRLEQMELGQGLEVIVRR